MLGREASILCRGPDPYHGNYKQWVSDLQNPTDQGTPAPFDIPPATYADLTLQCDEGKPVCKRCTKSRRVCLPTDAVKQAIFSIHVENRYASGEIRRPRGPRSSLTLLRPHFDIQARAQAYYLHYYVEPTLELPHLTTCVAGSLLAWQESRRNHAGPMIDVALSALALAIFAKTHQVKAAAMEAWSVYHRLLGMTRERIPSMDQENIEACLLTVLLMSRYEGSMHYPAKFASTTKDSFMDLRSWLHHDGALAILKVWNDNQSHLGSASCIIKHARRGSIQSALLRGLPLADWLLDGARFGEKGHQLEYDRILVRTVNLRHAMFRLGQQRYDADLDAIGDLDWEAQEIDKALRDYATNIPYAGSIQCHVLNEQVQNWTWPRVHFFSPTVCTYEGSGYAAMWTIYYAARILVNSTWLRILRLQSSNEEAGSIYDQKRLRCAANVKEIADHLAAALPFVLDRVKMDHPNPPSCQGSIKINTDEAVKPHLATLMVWPLTVASSVEGIDGKQQQWFRSELASIGRIVGDGILECADTKHWALM